MEAVAGLGEGELVEEKRLEIGKEILDWMDAEQAGGKSVDFLR